MTDRELALIRRRQIIRQRWLADPAAARKLGPDFVQATHDVELILSHLSPESNGHDPRPE